MYRLLALAILSAPGLASAGTWTTNEADFDHLPAEDFQSQPLSYWSAVDEASQVVVGDVGYWGMVWAASGWCIPGMDSSPPCGGSNVYLASAIDLHVVPQEPSNQLGYRIGTQGSEWHAAVTLDDGTVETVDLVSTTPNSWGGLEPVTGFLGYTADDGRTIVEIYNWGADGGIDDVRVGIAGPGACDSLEQTILDLGFQQGIENSLLAKVEAADRAELRGQNDRALQMLSALTHEVEAQVGSHLTQDQADEILACVQVRIDSLG